MKILWFTNTPCEATTYLTGERVAGGGWLYALCRHLKLLDEIELHIAFMWGKQMKPFEYDGVTYHPVLRNNSGSVAGRYIHRIICQFSDIYDRREVKRCLQVVDEVSPDVIHIHGSEEMFGLIVPYVDVHIPVVMSIQGILCTCRLKLFSGLTHKQVQQKESLFKKMVLDGINGDYRRISRDTRREQIIYCSLQYVIGRTRWDKRCALSLNPQLQYFTVNEILRPEIMNAQWKYHQPKDKFVIVSTISTGLYKGLEVIYQAANILKGQNFYFEWKIIGLSSNDEMVRIVEKIYALKATNVSINLLGRKNAQEMIDIMLQSDVYVQASHIENSPNALCEAMVLGMPIIASFAGGTSSMLQDGTEGVLIQDGNPYELAGAIMEVEKNHNEYVTMGQNARKRALKRHSPENVIAELMMVYSKLVG